MAVNVCKAACIYMKVITQTGVVVGQSHAVIHCPLLALYPAAHLIVTVWPRGGKTWSQSMHAGAYGKGMVLIVSFSPPIVEPSSCTRSCETLNCGHVGRTSVKPVPVLLLGF